MSPLVAFLILFPLAAGLALLGLGGRARAAVVAGAGALIAAASVAAAVRFDGADRVFFGPPPWLEPGRLTFGLELAITLCLAVLSARYRRLDALALTVAQGGLGLWLEATGRLPEVEPGRLFAVDRLSVVMILVIGLIGPLICLHAVGYMRDYHRHYPLVRGRRRMFFFLLFAFLSAMFGLVTANGLPLLLLFWEVTTLTSFLLIGYTRTKQTIGYAFNALSMNLVGGLAFSVALGILGPSPVGLDFARLCEGPAPAALLPAVALLALAGATKSAQLPFSGWLLGAMYAPTPTSALLHSSTMVKAGVFLLLRLSPAMAGSRVAATVAALGFTTFLFAAVIATTETNAKRVLAWSTIGNLGLVVGCAGLATPAALWVGTMVVIFHAAAKSLAFLAVGSVENRLYTKDLERFDHLLARFPRLGGLLLTAVAGMFLAPFGVVLAKWSAIRALVEVPGWQGPVFLLVMAYGSAATIYFWTKLLLKLIAVRVIDARERAVEARVSGYEWVSEVAHAALVIGLTLSVGALSDGVVSPLALGAFGAGPARLFHLGWPMVVVLALAVLSLPALAVYLRHVHQYDVADVYAGGRTVGPTHLVQVAEGGQGSIELRNYYLTGVVSGPGVFRAGIALGALFTAALAFFPLWGSP